MSPTGWRARLVGTVLLMVSLAACSSHAVTVGPSTGSTFTVLFDDTKAETAGNADWIVSTSMPDPTRQKAHPSRETDWTGALSAWGVALVKSGRYSVSTLPPSGSITYGDSGNPRDLSHYNEFVLPEPNVLFTSAERSAILAFVHAGGGLFMISDHSGSDRNHDGADSVTVLNRLMSGNPFGISINGGDISHANPHVLNSSDPVLNGPFGRVRGTIIRDGTTASLRSPARGEVFLSSVGSSGAAVVSSTYGSGRVVFWGDSSPIDDGSGQDGKTLYDGWNDSAGTDATLALNATEWLAG